MNKPEFTKSLLLIRHGESEANAGGVTTDYDTIALSPHGREQARNLANRFDESPSWIGLSPYLRARQTAQPLLDKFPSVVVHELAVEEFTYLAASQCVAMNAPSRQPLVDAYWARMSPEFCDGDGAESFNQFFQRATSFLRWAKMQPGVGVVFTHEQFIKAVFLAVMYPQPLSPTRTMNQFFALRSGLPIANTAIIRLQHDEIRWWIGGIDCNSGCL